MMNQKGGDQYDQWLEQLHIDFKHWAWGPVSRSFKALVQSSKHTQEQAKVAIAQLLNAMDGETESAKAYMTQRLCDAFIRKMPHWDDIDPISMDQSPHVSQLNTQVFEEGKAGLDELVVIKLNGGLGTSMGCQGPKGLIEVKNQHSFLSWTTLQLNAFNQRYNTRVPLILMNSAYTHEATRQWGQDHEDIIYIQQSMAPRLLEGSFLPCKDLSVAESKYPPGHAELYWVLIESGLYEQLISDGKRYAMISNIDNMGASVHLGIYGWLRANRVPFVMEVSQRTMADKKGGAVVKINDQMSLLEAAQVPHAHHAQFEDISTFTAFNTNTIWVDLVNLYETVTKKGLELPVIMNQKQIESCPIVQLEAAIGAGISNFPDAQVMGVNRDRFLPIKTTRDLFLLQSDLYALDSSGAPSRAKNHHEKEGPIVTLSEEFAKIQNYQDRVQVHPSLVAATHVQLKGDIWFLEPTILVGRVVIEVEQGARFELPKGQYKNCKLYISRDGQQTQVSISGED